MNEQSPDGQSPVFTVITDGPTPEQAAILQYLGLPSDGTITRAQAATSIRQAEADPANGDRFQSWHRDKYRLHPGLFTLPQRSFREARSWQAQISNDNLHGYSFRQPSLNQTLVILEALDTQEPGWERETKHRREVRFMNALATLSPELCKPGCSYPQELPDDDWSPSSDASAPATPRPPAAPSAPFIPGTTASPGFAPPPSPGKPSWNPAAPLSSLPRLPEPAVPPGRGSKGGWLWLLGLLLLLGVVGVVAAVGYAWSHRGGAESSARVAELTPPPPAPAVNTSPAGPTPAGRYAPVPAGESRQRAIARHPDLAQAGSPLNAKFIAAYHILESQHSPRLLQPDWPERLADEFAADAPPASKPVVTAASPKPAAAPRAAASPTPAAPKAPPAASPPPAPRNAGAPPATIAPAVAASAPASSPAGLPFVTLDAVNKTRANNYTYSWSPYYYADYDVSFRQTVGIEAKVRNMTHGNTAVVLRWMFFGRKTANNERYVFAGAQKRLELAAGQTVTDTLDSPMLQSKAAVGYTYGMHYYSGSKYEGWLVQVLPDGGDQVLKQVGSSGYIEDFGKRSDLTAMLKEQLTP